MELFNSATTHDLCYSWLESVRKVCFAATSEIITLPGHLRVQFDKVYECEPVAGLGGSSGYACCRREFKMLLSLSACPQCNPRAETCVWRWTVFLSAVANAELQQNFPATAQPVMQFLAVETGAKDGTVPPADDARALLDGAPAA